MKLKILFKDDSPRIKLIQDENDVEKTVGVIIEAPVIEWPIKSIDGEFDVDGENILYTIKAGIKFKCANCGKEKPREGFGINKGKRNGLQGWCIRCRAEQLREKRAQELLNEDE